MAQVKIESILEHLDHELRAALDETVRQHFPGATYNAHAMYKDFVRIADRKCSTWETVPDGCVQAK